MGRLIDADAFVKMMEDKCDMKSTLDPWVLSVCRGGVKMMPTVDAVPVQRCDGCYYADWHSNGCIAYCTKHGTDGHVADGFCSEGEKDGDGDD